MILIICGGQLGFSSSRNPTCLNLQSHVLTGYFGMRVDGLVYHINLPFVSIHILIDQSVVITQKMAEAVYKRYKLLCLILVGRDRSFFLEFRSSSFKLYQRYNVILKQRRATEHLHSLLRRVGRSICVGFPLWTIPGVFL